MALGVIAMSAQFFGFGKLRQQVFDESCLNKKKPLSISSSSSSSEIIESVWVLVLVLVPRFSL